MKLPVVTDGGATCFDCPAICCSSYVVPMTGFDVWRMSRGLQLPWFEVADVRADRAVWEGFALNGSDGRFGFFLRPRHAEVCRFLLQLPSGAQRCGAHASRPLACRVYPWKPDDGNQLGIELASHAMCPPPQRAHFESQKVEARVAIEEELAERPLYLFAVSRWNQHVARRNLPVAAFAEWVLALYDRLAPLRAQPSFQVEARRLIDAHPLP